MSFKLLETLGVPKPYLHSPVDDLESFYFTAQWALAFNDGASGGKYDGTRIRRFRKITGQNWSEAKFMVQNFLRPDTADAQYGPFFIHFLTFLSRWLEKLAAMGRDRNRAILRAKELSGQDMEKYLGLNSLIYGYRGVGEYLELVHEHRALLELV